MACPEAFQNDLAGRILQHVSGVLQILPSLIEVERSFIQLGGHSLLAFTLSKACLKDNIQLSVKSILQSSSISNLFHEAEQRQFQSEADRTPHVETSQILKRNQCASSPILQEPQRHQKKRRIQSTPQEVWNDGSLLVSEVYSDLTRMQTLFLCGSVACPGNNIISFHETYRTSDLPTVREAWQKLIESEPLFRSQLRLIGGKGYLVQCSKKKSHWNEHIAVSRQNYIDLIEAEPKSVLWGTTFDVITFQGDGSLSLSTVIWRCNHGLIDGYSAKLIYGKFRALVSGHEGFKTISMAEKLPEIVRYEHMSSDANKLPKGKRHFKTRHHQGQLTLPAKVSVEKVVTKRLSCISLRVPTSEVLSRASDAGVSVASIYHAAWALTLTSFMNTDHVQFGVVLSDRDIEVPGVENTIGTLIKMQALGVSLDVKARVDEFLRGVYSSLTELSGICSGALDDGLHRELDTILSMQFSMTPDPLEKTCLPVSPPRMEMIGEIPLSVCIWPDGDVKLDFHTARFAESDVQSIASYFSHSLHLLCSNRTMMNDVVRDIMPAQMAERSLQLSHALANETNPGSISDDLVTRFERIVRDYGWATAVEKGNQSLSYHELDQRATHLASHLADTVVSEDVVSVSADRSIHWITAIIAVLKASATYSPLDPKLPMAIKKSMLEAADVKVLLVGSNNEKEPIPTENCKVLSTQELLQTPLSAAVRTQHRASAEPAINAYVCFTSGSSGKPKGVVCTHEGLLAFHSSEETRMYSAPGVRVAQTMSPAFDGSIHEIFSTLGWGGTLVLPASEEPFSNLHSVHSAVITPSIAKALDPQDYPLLRTLSVVGEPLPQDVSDIWSANKTVFNMYGPTEGTCGATTQRMTPGEKVKIGPPNSTTRLYILDRHGNHCPPNVPGEIHLAGIQVARGYIGRPEETARRFLVDPFVGHNKQRMYRTGDRGSVNERGEVTYIGREDRLIKLRGFRLDLNDLETRIVKGVPDITAAAITRDGGNLVAMVQPASLDPVEVRKGIEQVLPPYAIPEPVTVVDKFPKTSIGKIDYTAIAQKSSSAKTAGLPDLPQLSPNEHTISSIWKNILNIDTDKHISLNSDFRFLGGHSLLQLVLVERLRETFHVNISFKKLIQDQTLGAISQLVELHLREHPTPLNTVQMAGDHQPLGYSSLSPLDHDWWCKYQYDPSATASFTVAYAASFDKAIIDADRLAAAWDAVIARHDLLRCRHVQDANGSLNRVYVCAGRSIRVDHIDMRAEVNKPFNLSHDAPVRVLVAPDAMLFCASHIICDYTALSIILSELVTAYAGEKLPTVTATFADTLAWSNPTAPSALEFWRNTFTTRPPPLFPSRTSYTGTSAVFALPSHTYRAMQTLCDNAGLTLQQLALAAVALVLTLDRESTDVILGAPFLNRTAQDTAIVGNFVTALPIRLTFPPAVLAPEHDRTNASFLKEVQASCQDSLAHAVSYDRIVAALPYADAIPNDALLEVMVTMHDERRARKLSQVGLPSARSLAVWGEGSKFKLMCEFCAIGQDTLTLRVEWDESIVGTVHHIQGQVGLMQSALEGLTEGLDYDKIRKRLRQVRDSLGDGIRIEDWECFGKPLDVGKD